MGAVYRANDTRLARQVAVKLLAAESLGDQAARERLIREARAIAALHHPGIVHVYDVGETDDGGAFLVMELVTGTPLRALVHDDSWTDTARLTAIVEAARALEAAHRAGIVHRDVKPDNLMLRDDGRVALLDFGIAKQAPGQQLSTNLTGTGVVVGTPAYLSPEQARGRALDARTDQFSLAVTAYELLTRNIPWTATSAIAVVAAIMNDPTPPLRLSDAALAQAVGPVLERATAKKPEDRFPDLDAFADALSQAAGIAPPPSGLSLSIPQPPRSSGTRSVRGDGARGVDAERARASRVGAELARSHDARARLAQAVVDRGGRRACRRDRGGGGRRLAPSAQPARHAPRGRGVPDARGRGGRTAGAVARRRRGIPARRRSRADARRLRRPRPLPGRAPADARVRPDARELDPWRAQGLRERAIGAATSAGSAWLDGRIEVRGAQASIEVTLRTATGRVLGSASATGGPLRRLVLEACRKLREAGALGRDHTLEPEFRAMARRLLRRRAGRHDGGRGRGVWGARARRVRSLTPAAPSRGLDAGDRRRVRGQASARGRAGSPPHDVGRDVAEPGRPGAARAVATRRRRRAERCAQGHAAGDELEARRDQRRGHQQRRAGGRRRRSAARLDRGPSRPGHGRPRDGLERPRLGPGQRGLVADGDTPRAGASRRRARLTPRTCTSASSS